MSPSLIPPGDPFNWVFLVELLAFGAVTLIFLFYFNRIFAFFVSLIIRWYSWRTYKVYISFESLQVSLLAGRLFFKGARYHGENETVLIQDGYITWRYWLRRVKDNSLSEDKAKAGGTAGGRRFSGGEQGGHVLQSELPCRILVEIRGLEWYIYNRNPAYDTLLQHRKRSSNDTDPSDPAKADVVDTLGSPKSSSSSAGEKSTPFFTSRDDLSEKIDTSHTTNSIAPSRTATRESGQGRIGQQFPLPGPLKLLPIGFQCDRGAVVMGNENIRSVLVAKFECAKGEVSIQSSRPEDLYRQMFDVDITRPIVQLKPNRDFKETQLASVARSGSTKKELGHKRTLSVLHSHSILRRTLHNIRQLIPSFRSAVVSLPVGSSGSTSKNPDATTDGRGQNRWLGLSRYIDDDEDGLVEQERWKAIEYAKMENIVESPQVVISVFWDVPGVILDPVAYTSRPARGFERDINGTVPPDWGIDVRVSGGVLNYGPWADRQRTDLQNFFFPTLYQNSVPAIPLQAGQTRVATAFRLRVEIEAPTTLRIPTREESKDWKWKNQAMASDDLYLKRKARRQSTRGRKEEKTSVTPEIRPAGWLEITLARDTSFTNTMDLVASRSGYSNKLELDIKGPEISSSVNNGLLLRSKSANIKCDLSAPLKWNAQRNWAFDINSPDLELFLIRDHIFLLTDLVSDWASGPPGEYYTYVPFNYSLNAQLPNFRIYLNTNDSNIINNPSDINDNTFIVIWGEVITAKVNIPLRNFRPLSNEVTFEVTGQNGGFQLRVPPWNTQHTFLDTREIASLKDLRLDGSYNYHTSTSSILTDTAFVNLYGGAPKIHLYGFLIRYFIKFKDNYFGEDRHFQTLEEYQSQVSSTPNVTSPSPEESLPARVSNDLDVILTVATDDCCAMLPGNLYSATDNIKLDIRSITADLRFTNYYMDLEISLSPLVVSKGTPANNQEPKDIATTSAEAFVDGLSIRGHRIFGLPPSEPTYVCNWDFDIGSVSGECSTDFIYGLMSSLQCIAFSFEDAENTLPPLKPLVLHDVTFLRAKVDSVNVWVHAGNAAFLVRAETIKVTFNDWAGAQYSNRVTLTIPAVVIAAVDARTAARHKSGRQLDVTTHAYLRANVNVQQVTTKPHFSKDRQLQQHHIDVHDARTRRTPWLVYDKSPDVLSTLRERKVKLRPATMPVPPMPEPIDKITSSSTTSISRSLYSNSTGIEVPNGRGSTFLSNHSSRQRVASRGSLTVKEDIYRRLSQTRSSSVWERMSPKPSAGSTSIQTSSRALASPFPRTSVSGITFTSSYQMPHFRLYTVEPDLRNVPELPILRAKMDKERDLNIEYETSAAPDDETSRSALNASLPSGIAAYCTPEAVQSLNELLMGLQAKDPVALLDRLQIAAMADVLSQRDRASINKSLRLRFELPAISFRFVNRGAFVVPNSNSATSISYDIHASNLLLIAQSNQPPNLDLQDEGSHETLLHLELDEIDSSVTIKAEAQPKNLAKIEFSCNMVNLWLASNPGLTGEIQLQTFQLTSMNREVEHLASLLTSTEMLSQRVIQDFQRTNRRDGVRRQWLILRLNESYGSLPDPLFLTSASYILRSANQHLRTSDSWKMISRLRFVQHSLPPSTLDQMRDDCSSRTLSCPGDAKLKVIDSFKQWRSWDLSNVEASALIKNIYGPPSVNDAVPDQSLLAGNVKLSFKAAQIAFTVDPGPQQNHVSLERLVIEVLSGRPRLSTSHTHKSRLPSGKWTAEAFIGSISVSLNWDVLGLVTDINKQLRLTDGDSSKNTTSEQSVGAPSKSIEVHAVVVVQQISFSFATIHLLCHTISRDIRTSFVLSNNKSHNLLFIGLSDIVSNISLQSRQLVTLNLQGANIHASLTESNLRATKVSNWKLGATCKDLSINLKEDPQSLIGVADLVVGDEIASLKYAITNLQQAKSPGELNFTAKPSSREPSFHIALLMESFQIGLAILPSLTYIFEGAVARSTIQKSEVTPSSVIIDFDLKEQVHRLVKGSRLPDSNVLGEDICSVPLPSINGRLTFPTFLKMQSVSGHFAMETVALDASSLHNLALTIYQSDFLTLQQSVSRDLSTVQNHYRAVMAPNATSDSSNMQKGDRPIFNLSFYVAGLDIRAVAVSVIEKSASLHLHLGFISFKISNNSRESGIPQEIPDASIGVQEVSVKLERLTTLTNYLCGEVKTSVFLHSTSKLIKMQNAEKKDAFELVKSYKIRLTDLEVNLYTETASVFVDILGHLQQRFKAINFTQEIKNLRDRRQLRARTRITRSLSRSAIMDNDDTNSISFFKSTYSLEMDNIQISWIIGDLLPISPGHETEDLVLSIRKIDLATKEENAARLMIQDFQLQMVPTSRSKKIRSFNSALLPQLLFNVAYDSTPKEWKLIFQVVGKLLDLRLTTQFLLPASDLQRSIGIASQALRTVVASWNASLAQVSDGKQGGLFGNKTLSSLLVAADFAGAVVFIQGKDSSNSHCTSINQSVPGNGQWGRSENDRSEKSTILRAPGVAWKIEYKDVVSEDKGIDDKTKGIAVDEKSTGREDNNAGGKDKNTGSSEDKCIGRGDRSLIAEIRVDASENTLHSSVVGLIMEISSSVKEIVGEPEQVLVPEPKSSPKKLVDGEKLRSGDPVAILGSCRLRLGLRIRKQKFSLNCEPDARVAATAKFEDIYVTINTVQDKDQARFFAIGAFFTNLDVSVHHAYSQQPTGTFQVDSVVMSLMNSKHISSQKGITAILKFSPLRIQINAKQLQDFQLFWKIWLPPDLQRKLPVSSGTNLAESQMIIVQRYQQVAASAAFPWDASIYMNKIDIQVELGQSLGKASLSIEDFWISSKKTSDWEQNLCVGFKKGGIDCNGRVGVVVDLHNFGVRTSIRWPSREDALNQTPLIQASVQFDNFQGKAAFDYQPFVVAKISSLEILMYNVRESLKSGGDRLVAIADSDQVKVFCIATSAAQAVSFYQAFEKLIQEKQAAFKNSLKEVRKVSLRESSVDLPTSQIMEREESNQPSMKTPIQLQTNVVVTIRKINLGAFPGSFFDNQILRLEASDTSARFAAVFESGKIHSGLGLTLGKLWIALPQIKKQGQLKAFKDISVEEVIESVIGSVGATIINIPTVLATMQTWQTPESNVIEYIFNSSLEGTIGVGYNYSRIHYIRSMYANHKRALAHRLGRALPPSAVRITGGPTSGPSTSGHAESQVEKLDITGEQTVGQQQKITAVVNMPASKYTYVPLEPPVVAAPQLQALGEATPPLELFGLNKARLPDLTHQIVIISLLEVAKEVEDAYSKILGAS
ncbi:MAG: hypothetical protein MMC33_005775 [Icmadophila ericetorum]|nr:hypothetical protein [Icmadophila ericetorum]